MNAIFEKHWDALVTTAESTSTLSLPAVRLALHLAIRDAHDAGREMWCSDNMSSNLTPQGKALELDNALGEIDKLRQDRNALLAQITRLGEWLKVNAREQFDRLHTTTIDDAIDVLDMRQEEINELRQRVANLEAMTAEHPGYEEQQNRLMRWLIDNEPERITDHRTVAGAVVSILDEWRAAITNYDTALSHAQNENAMLRQQRATLQADLDGVQQAREENRQEVQLLRQELAQAEQNAADLKRRLDAANTNVASLDPTPTPDWGPSHPAWQRLTAEEQETIAKLTEGAIRFRNVPKPLRLILIGQVLRHIGGGNSKITMAQYNSQRPAWMAEATSITNYVESGKWQDVVTVALIDTAPR